VSVEDKGCRLNPRALYSPVRKPSTKQPSSAGHPSRVQRVALFLAIQAASCAGGKEGRQTAAFFLLLSLLLLLPLSAPGLPLASVILSSCPA